ncbi:hypothetical protein [Granulicella sp. L46]|uniref:hypothetical protein n=1 Tax=Granulicella sp. L46 TaxID=1641865 RepID=UPI00131D2509|nr:hypothetical protein [Granulicella sp. L46]
MPLSEAHPASRNSRVLTVFITIARYLLGLGILIYGISKLTNIQFQVSAWSYAQPMSQVSGRMLAWAFLGYEPWFQFLLGVFETIPGLLLLSRRTWRLGALLLLPVMLNVVLMNFALDLWHDTKVISCLLLSMNLFLVACDFQRYRSFLKVLLPAPRPFLNGRIQIAATVASVLVPVVTMGCFWFIGMMPANRAMAQIADLVGTRQINGAGTWGVDRIIMGGQVIPGAPDRKMYFDIFMQCGYQSGLEKSLGSYTASRDKHSLNITGLTLGQDSSPIIANYSLQGKTLTIEGQRSGHPVEIVLRRLNWGPLLPFSR